MSHTSRPWRRAGLRVVCQRGTIAEIPAPQDGGVFECSANADLLAAAPDLLEALQACRTAMTLLIRAIPVEQSADYVPQLDDAERADLMADAAIAKATGEPGKRMAK